jgi:hypothetical protein
MPTRAHPVSATQILEAQLTARKKALAFVAAIRERKKACGAVEQKKAQKQGRKRPQKIGLTGPRSYKSP